MTYPQIEKLKIDEYSLNLENFSVEDSFGLLVEKLNKNFREVQNNGGGPVGHKGDPGEPGCAGQPGPPGPIADGFDDWESSNPASTVCDCDELDCENYINDLSVNNLLFNKWANKTFLFTNLSLDDTNVILRNLDEEHISTDSLCLYLHDYKLKVYNGYTDGYGKHIHLLNSFAAQQNSDYMCKSGFTISNDIILNTNIEKLRFTGNKNDNIVNHELGYEFNGDYLDLRGGSLKQVLGFDSGDYTDTLTPYVSRFNLTEQTSDNVFMIPNGSGWMGLWRNTLYTKDDELSEKWEVVDKDDLIIKSLRFKANGNNQYIDSTNLSSCPIKFNNGSVVRFKRLNNWVLIDYHIGLQIDTNIVPDPNATHIELVNLQIKINIPTLSCRTINWLPGTIMEREVLNDDVNMKFFSMFKIDSETRFTDNDTFMISQKFPSNFIHLDYNETTDIVWSSGQAWATVTEYDCCVTEVTQDDICIYDIVIEQDGVNYDTCGFNTYEEYNIVDVYDYHEYDTDPEYHLHDITIILNNTLAPYANDDLVVKYISKDNNDVVTGTYTLIRNTDYIYYSLTHSIVIDNDALLSNISTITDNDLISICYTSIDTSGTIDDDDIIVFKNYENHTMLEVVDYIASRIGSSGSCGCTSGTSGVDGSSGVDGTFYGSSGTSGVDGTFYGSSGTSGVDGADGSSGTSGVDGSSGTSGSSGSCQPCSSGTSGSSGFGSSGTTGSSGTSGTTGSSGTSGTSGSSGTGGGVT